MRYWLRHTLSNIQQRCKNPNHPQFRYWGGKGIECRFKSIEELQDALGDRPTNKHSIDRIDNQGHYEKGNVRWATAVEQAANKSLCPFSGIFWNKWRGKWIGQYKGRYLCLSDSFADCLATKILQMEKYND